MYKKWVIAVFDFDETIVIENSLGQLFRYVTGSQWYVVKALPAIIRYVIKPGNFYYLRKLVKFHLYHSCLSGRSVDSLNQAGVFALKHLTFNPVVVDHLKQHVAEGDIVIIATASPWLYVQSILKTQGVPFDSIIGTELEIHDEPSRNNQSSRLSGYLLGEECSRNNKWLKIEAHILELGLPNYELVAYGNRPDDVDLLQQADTGYVVSGRKITLFK